MKRMDPAIIMTMVAIGIPEGQIAKMQRVDAGTINDYIECCSTGFDCALMYIGGRLEKAGMSNEAINTVLGVDYYQEMKDSILLLPTSKKEEISIESLNEYLDEEQIQKLKTY